jgi:hypothetical protein
MTAQAMRKTLYVLVPRSTSSKIIGLEFVILFTILAVSDIFNVNVDRPRDKSSPAPMREQILPMREGLHFLAGA